MLLDDRKSLTSKRDRDRVRDRVGVGLGVGATEIEERAPSARVRGRVRNTVSGRHGREDL